MRPILQSPRVLRTGQPLSLEGIRQHCPAVFAEGPHQSRGERYRYVPTIEPLKALIDNGWGVYEASQQRSRAADRDPYTKHMLRLRRLDDFYEPGRRATDPAPTTDGVAEVILINAHDGTAAYHMKAGYFRFVCSNGLIAGTTLAGFKVLHTVGKQTSEEVLEAGQKLVTESFPVLLESIDKYKRLILPKTQQYRLAQRGLDLRYPNVVPPFMVDDLLAVTRPEDEEPTLWNILNRVQERALYGGWEIKTSGFDRRSVVRPVERVSAVTAINGGIWDEAAKIAEEMTA